VRIGERNVEVETRGKVGNRISRGVKESRVEIEGSILEFAEGAKIAETAGVSGPPSTTRFAWFSRDWVADQIRCDCLLFRRCNGCATLGDLHEPFRSCGMYRVKNSSAFRRKGRHERRLSAFSKSRSA